jgi:hypothetical protein
MEHIMYFFTKQATSMRRSTVLYLSLQLVFPAWRWTDGTSFSLYLNNGPQKLERYNKQGWKSCLAKTLQLIEAKHLTIASGSSTVVKHLPHHPKVQGSIPAPAARAKWRNKV